MRGQNVAKECSNNNEICRYAWNISMHFQALAAGRGEAGIFAYSPGIARVPDECAVRFTSAIIKKGAVEGIEPSLSAERSFGPPGDDRDRYKFPLSEHRAPYPTPCLGELKHRIRASTALRCLPACYTARAYRQFGKAMRYSYMAANSSLSIFPIGCHGISLPSW